MNHIEYIYNVICMIVSRILVFFAGFFLKSILLRLSDLQGTSVGVRLNCALVENRDGHLRVRGLRTELVVSIAHALANRVDTN